jgi:hypothetical protein
VRIKLLPRKSTEAALRNDVDLPHKDVNTSLGRNAISVNAIVIPRTIMMDEASMNNAKESFNAIVNTKNRITKTSAVSFLTDIAASIILSLYLRRI